MVFLSFAEFPKEELDSHLPKLVRAGQRVAICEQAAEQQDIEQETHRGIHR